MLPQNHSGQELLLLIRRSMRMGDVDAVYHTLRRTSLPEAEKICFRYEMEVGRFENGEINSETWCLDQIRSFEEILKWPDFRQNEEPLEGELDKKLLLRLVNSFELDKALQLCESLGDRSILTQAQYKIFEKLFHEGKIELEIWELLRHSTQYQLWELGQSSETTLNFCVKSLITIKKWFQCHFK